MATFKIGRADTNDIVLADKSISRQHAEMEELGGGRFKLKDLGSSSGTHVLNGAEWQEIKEAEVRYDTRIRFGEHETTPMALLPDQDKTVMGAKAAPPAPPRPAVAPRPGAPKPAAPAPAPPRPAAPKPAAPAPAAPRPAGPRPAAPRPAAAARPAGAPGAGMDKKTMWFILGGAGGLILLAIIVVVIVLATGGDETRTATPSTPTTPTPTSPTPTPATPTPATPTPATPAPQGAGPQRVIQACARWPETNANQCQCVARVIQPDLQAGDYDEFIAVMGMLAAKKEDEGRQRMQQLAQRDPQQVARLVKAITTMSSQCGNVR